MIVYIVIAALVIILCLTAILLKFVQHRSQIGTKRKHLLLRYQSLYEHFPTGLFTLDRQGRYTDVNRAGCGLLGMTRQEIIGRDYLQDILPEHKEPARGCFFSVLQGNSEQVELTINHRLGHPVHLSVTVVPVWHEREVIGVHGISENVTPHFQMKQELRDSDLKFHKLVEHTQLAVVVSKGGVIQYANPATMALLRVGTVEELIGEEVGCFIDMESLEVFRANLARIQAENPEESTPTACLTHEYRYRRPDGSKFYGETVSVVVRDGGEVAILCMVRDMTGQKLAEERLRQMAYYDSLTGLPNRRMFTESLADALTGEDVRVAVLFLDLDRFKLVNDSFGHDFGDEILKMSVSRLESCVPSGQLLARLGGDEFTVLCFNFEGDIEQPLSTATTILEAFSVPFTVSDIEIHLKPSIGIALYSDTAQDAGTLMKQADSAMYRAKELGGNRIQIYHEEMGAKSWQRILLENQLRRALSRKEFELWYQPKLSAKTREIVGVEALIRWNRPDSGLVPPALFIPVAEETGLIVQLGEWVLREACHQGVAWCKDGLPAVRVAVNVSVHQIKHGNIVATVRDILEETGFCASSLEIEITESSVMENAEQMVLTIRQLALLGVRVSVDDFGTGYSSLSYLKQFDIDSLKIDKSFIDNVHANTQDWAIVSAIIKLGHSLEMTVVAEGVEFESQLEALENLECDEIQGYVFQPPLPASEFAKFHATHRSLSS